MAQRDSRSFSGRGILLVAKAVELAHGWMYERGLLRGSLRENSDRRKVGSGAAEEVSPDAVTGGGWSMSETRGELILGEAA